MIVMLQDVAPLHTNGILDLQPGQVDVWYWFYNDDPNPDALSHALPLLSGHERTVCQKFQFDRDRRNYLATRLLQRQVLSRYAPVPPEKWQFAATPEGKPFITAPALKRHIHFNLSNTGGLVVCAVSLHHQQIGIDVERLDRAIDPDRMAKRIFSAEEYSNFSALSSSARQRRFLEHWTLKESYTKALGIGLELPFDQFGFRIGEKNPNIELLPPVSERNATDWQFILINAEPEHLISLSVNSGGEPLSLRAASGP